MNLNEIAQKLRHAFLNATPIGQFSEIYPDFTDKQAMEVQNIGLEMALGSGDKLVGYKMGLTSKAKQRDVNVFEPIRGYLLSSFELQKGSTLSLSNRIHPRVEPEVAVIFKQRLQGPGLSLRDVVGAIDAIYPALEIVDSRFDNFKFKLSDVLADNTSAAGFMLGRTNLLSEINQLSLMGVIVRKNGRIVETGAPAAVLGDPLLSVLSLANSLGAEGKAIEPGQVILTGGITNSVSFVSGDRLEIAWPQELLTFQAL